jgi:predicted HAD superfamily phosphohydrolase YqeG
MASGTVIPIGLHSAREGRLSHYLVPDLYAPSVADIDFAEVRDYMGLTPEDPLHVLSDLDGTVRVAEEPCVHEPTAAHIRDSLDLGVISTFTLTPNSFNPCINRFGWQIHSSVSTYSSLLSGYKKPRAEFFRYAIAELGIAGEPILIQGDKVTRDVLGARRLGGGAVSLLVPRLGENDLPADRIIGRRFDNAARRVGHSAMLAANRCRLALGMV